MNSTIQTFLSKVREAQLLPAASLAELEKLAERGELSSEAALSALVRRPDEAHADD